MCAKSSPLKDFFAVFQVRLGTVTRNFLYLLPIYTHNTKRHFIIFKCNKVITFADALQAEKVLVTLGVCVCVRRAATARRISLGGEGNALYPVLSIVEFFF